jgi:hypothetical protein
MVCLAEVDHHIPAILGLDSGHCSLKFIPMTIGAISNVDFTLVVFGVLSLVLLTATVYIQHPRFSGSSPRIIEVIAYRPFSSEIAYRKEITDRAACDMILQGLGQARFAFFGFKPTGVLNIQYDNGRVDHLKFTQCNDAEQGVLPGAGSGWG